MTTLHFDGTLSAAEAAELDAIRAETGRKVELCRRDPPQWCRRDPLLVWLVPRGYGFGGDRARMGEPARSEVFEVFEVDPARFPALAARIARAAAEDEAALREEHDEGSREEERVRLAGARIGARNALAAANGRIIALDARWRSPDDASWTDDAARAALAAEMDAAQEAFRRAEEACNEAEEAESLWLTAERTEAEHEARAVAGLSA